MKNDVQNNKLLTIAIPTYNRRAYLEECLNHICPQLNDKVKVVVRDNKSFNYDFDEFITPYKEKYGVEAYQNVDEKDLYQLLIDCILFFVYTSG